MLGSDDYGGMSRDVYGGGGGGGGVPSSRSPRPQRRDLSSDPYYLDQGGHHRAHSPQPSAAARRSRSATRAASPTLALDHGGPYMDPHATMEADRRSGSAPGTHHRSRSQSRSNVGRNYHSLDREAHDREFMPIRDPRDRSMERGGAMDIHGVQGGHMARRDRSLDRGPMLEDDLYRDHHSMGRSRASPNTDLSGRHGGASLGGMGRDGYFTELQMHNSDLQKELGNLKKELELTNQKLGSSMHSIKTFWSPELKKERALRKEESAKYSLINDQLKLLNSENQKQAMLVRQLEEELRHQKTRGLSVEVQSQLENLSTENDHLNREVAILRETIKELELRIETQKQTLAARDESIKKLLEMLQQKGIGKEEERAMMQQMQAVFQKQLEESRLDIQKRDQEILALSAKMKTLEEQHSDYQRHITVLKESLCAKEEHYNMLQADVEELRQRLEEKNKTIEKKTQQALQTTQERNKLTTELTELRDHMDIKDRKINVLQRKLDLHEANQKLQNGARSGNDSQAIKRQLEEQMKMVEQKVHTLEQRNKQLDEKEKTLVELDARLNKKREQINNMEQQLAKSHAADGAPPSEANKQLAELRRALGEKEKEMEALYKERAKAESDAKAAQSETERLLQVMQMGQEEQFAKDKTIKDLQEALKAAGGGSQPKKTSIASTPSTPAKMDGIPAGISTPSAGQMAATAAEKASAASEAAKATLEQAKNVAQPPKEHSCSDHQEIELLEMEGRQREYRLRIDQMDVDIKLKDSLINNLSDENKRQRERLQEMEEEIHVLEEEMKKNEKMEELEQLVVVVKHKNERIEELEEALRQSVRIATDMEMEKRDEEDRRKEITEKLNKLENRLASAQNAQNLRCTSCRPTRQRLSQVEARYNAMVSERRHHLQELFDMKHEALTSALSEKDAHLALLEVGGVRSSRAAQELETLKKERTKLLDSIKHLGEERVRLSQEYAVADIKLDATPPETPPPQQDAREDASEDATAARTHL